MPLLDHFHPPLSEEFAWTTIHAGWAGHITEDLNNRWLTADYVAGEFAMSGSHPEIDIATYEQAAAAPAGRPGDGTSTATLARPTWEVAAPAVSFAPVFPDVFEIHIATAVGRRLLVGVIELIGPSNKDRPASRQGFAARTAAFLQQGVSVVLVDIVTNKLFNLHNEVIRLFEAPEEAAMPDENAIYAVSYRPTLREDKPQIDVWREALAVGQALPTMPLRLKGDLFVPVHLESTYMAACRGRRVF
jgi:hypothetical protein